MRYMAYALILFFGSAAIALAQPYSIQLDVSWEMDKTPTDFVLYLCDKPITGEFGGNFSDESLIGKCEGALYQRIIPGTQRQLTLDYDAPTNQGTVYARISPRQQQLINGTTRMVESDLSEQATAAYDITVVERDEAPVRLQLKSSKEIVIK